MHEQDIEKGKPQAPIVGVYISLTSLKSNFAISTKVKDVSKL